MTGKDKSTDVENTESGAEAIKDEALEQAEGGFSLSGAFSTTFNTTTVNTRFTNVNLNTDQNLTQSSKTDEVAALRRRPGRIGPV